MSKALAQALERRYEAEKQIERVLRRDYPPGTQVTWKKNGIHEGIILDKASEDRVRVRNAQTGREYWIYAYCLVEAMAAEVIK